MKFIRIFLLVLIIIGIGLLCTQRFWVPRLVSEILKYEGDPAATTMSTTVPGVASGAVPSTVSATSAVRISQLASTSPVVTKIAFSSVQENVYTVGGVPFSILFHSDKVVQNTVSFLYNGVHYQIVSTNVPIEGRQAPILFAHKILYLDTSNNTWVSVPGQEKFEQGFGENVGYMVVGYKDALFVIFSARDGFHYDEMVSVYKNTLVSYNKISDSTLKGFVSDGSAVYVQVDKSLCSDWPQYSCAEYFKLGSDGTMSQEQVTIPDSFEQRQG